MGSKTLRLVIFRENWLRVLYCFLYQKCFVLGSFSNKVFFSKNMTAAFTVDDPTQWLGKAGSDVLCRNNPIKVSSRMYEISQVFCKLCQISGNNFQFILFFILKQLLNHSVRKDGYSGFQKDLSHPASQLHQS